MGTFMGTKSPDVRGTYLGGLTPAPKWSILPAMNCPTGIIAIR